MTAKDTKLNARYDVGNGTQRCGMCKHYRIGLCTKTEGTIHSNMWCKHFEKRDRR